MISWMHQMIEEGLLYPTVTAAIADTEALFTAGNAFITYSEFKKIPTLNATGRATDPDFNAAGGAPFAIGDHGVGETFTPSIASYNWAISTQCERLDDVLTYIDWLYSEEGIHVINYGEEGLTYTLDAEGNVVWNEEALASGNPQSYYGLGRECIYGVYDFHAFTSWQEDSFKQTVEDVMPLAVQKRTPSIKKYNEEQQMIADTYGQAYTTFVKSELTKFLVGERDLAEWDNYVKEANETYHGEDLVKIASEAWAAQNS